ncbi:hypothetical protein Syun_021786 [Stephania yunnanensis]|uniref:UDP-N-acetylmuramate dehydrogenase n=1 Tax=Stephania yunnanensis TaxID=152371 RepID=A0AAP0IG86_9MAGN
MPLQLSLHSSSSSSSSSPLNLFSSNSCPETPQRHLHMGHRRPMCPLRPSFRLFGGVFNRFCRDNSIGFVIVGKGSNCLFDDKGFHGRVILNRIDFVQNTDDGLLGGCYRVGSGCPFNRFGIQSCIDGFSGLEFAGGIPGTVGGAVYMNAGADAQEMEDLAAIVSVTFRLKASSSSRVRQQDYMARWRLLQPAGERSAGSVFRNPLGVGISAGELIEKAGMKGFRVGESKGGSSLLCDSDTVEVEWRR